KPVKVALPLIPIGCPAPPSTETVYPFGSRLCPVVLVVTVRSPVEAVTVTVAVWLIGTPLIVADTVFVSATVELSVPVVTPLAFVGPGCVRLLPVPVALSTAVAPLIAFPFASRAVTVIVELPLPTTIEVGVAVTVDCEADTGAGVTDTLAVWVNATPPAVAEIVFVPLLVELNVLLHTPL